MYSPGMTNARPGSGSNDYDPENYPQLDEVDYDPEFDVLTEAKKKERIKKARQGLTESGIPDEELSELEDDDPKLARKQKKAKATPGKKAGGSRPKAGGRKKAHELEDDADKTAIELQKMMVTACEADLDSFHKGEPALHRFTLLPTVISIMTKAYNQNSLLELGILQEVRSFLEPLPDGNLPIINIQKELLQILGQMPISPEMLRTSYLGRIVKFYAICPRVTQEVQKLADQLVSRWTQLVTRQSLAASIRRKGQSGITRPPPRLDAQSGDKNKQPDIQKRLLTAMAKAKLSNRRR